MIRVHHKDREGFENVGLGCHKTAIVLKGELPVKPGVLEYPRNIVCASCGKPVWLVFYNPTTLLVRGVEAWTEFTGEKH